MLLMIFFVQNKDHHLEMMGFFMPLMVISSWGFFQRAFFAAGIHILFRQAIFLKISALHNKRNQFHTFLV